MRARWTAYIPRKMSPPTRPRSCYISIQWSVLTAAPAFRCARFRPSSHSTICQRSGTLLPSAMPSTSGGSAALTFSGLDQKARVPVWRAPFTLESSLKSCWLLSFVRVAEDLGVLTGMGLDRVKDVDVFVLVHAQDKGFREFANVIVNLEPMTLRLGEHHHRTHSDRRRKD